MKYLDVMLVLLNIVSRLIEMTLTVWPYWTSIF